MPATEAGLIKSFVKILREAGAHVDKNHGGPNSRGRADLQGSYKGLAWAVEAKQPGKEHNVTELQKAWLRSFQQAGGIGIVASHRDEIKRLIRVMDRRARAG